MNSLIHRCLTVALLASASFLAFAQTPAPDLQAERKAAMQAANAAQQVGPAEISVRDQAVLKLPKGYGYVPTPAAGQLLRVMGNTPSEQLVGLVFPEDDKGWFMVVQFVKEGYIKDDDAKEWNADDLLKSLKDGTEAGNEDRAQRGIRAIEVAGWAEKPAYDAASHRLVWAAITREKGASTSSDQGAMQGVNLNTYALGREGYISMNLVTSYADLEKHRPEALQLLAAMQYNEGKKYADFNSSTDSVAAYGLAALVAGAAVKKLGLFAVILAFLAKFAKVIFVAVAGLGWGFTKFFKKKPKEVVTPELAAAPAAPDTSPAPEQVPPPKG